MFMSQYIRDMSALLHSVMLLVSRLHACKTRRLEHQIKIIIINLIVCIRYGVRAVGRVEHGPQRVVAAGERRRVVCRREVRGGDAVAACTAVHTLLLRSFLPAAVFQIGILPNASRRAQPVLTNIPVKKATGHKNKRSRHRPNHVGRNWWQQRGCAKMAASLLSPALLNFSTGVGARET